MTDDLGVSIEPGELEAHNDLIHRVTRAAATKAQLYLPLSGVSVEFRADASASIPELGLAGFAPHGHLIRVSVDPSANDLQAKLQRHLPRVLTHEWHHCARWRGPGYGTTLGEALVTEGLADHFDVEVHRAAPYGWATALNDGEAAHWWLKAQEELWHKTYDHAHWFFNRERTGPPFQAGYALGYRVVAAYLAVHPGTAAADLAHSPAELIMSEAEARGIQSARK